MNGKHINKLGCLRDADISAKEYKWMFELRGKSTILMRGKESRRRQRERNLALLRGVIKKEEH